MTNHDVQPRTDVLAGSRTPPCVSTARYPQVEPSGWLCTASAASRLKVCAGGVLREVFNGSGRLRLGAVRSRTVIAMRGSRRWPTRLATAIVISAALLTAGCTSSSRPGASSSTTPTSTPTLPSQSPSPEDLAKKAVLASYDSYWTARANSLGSPTNPPDPNLSKYAIEGAYSDIGATIILFRKNGIEMRGAPAHSAQVTSISLADPTSASITDCLDSTHWLPVYAATGKSALAAGQALRVVVDSTATLYNGQWVIRTAVAHRDRPC